MTNDNWSVCTARRDKGPHEPIMYDAENFLWPIAPDVGHPRLRACRLCGSLYLQPSGKPEAEREG